MAEKRDRSKCFKGKITNRFWGVDPEKQRNIRSNSSEKRRRRRLKQQAEPHYSVRDILDSIDANRKPIPEIRGARKR